MQSRVASNGGCSLHRTEAVLTFLWPLQWFTICTQTQKHPCRENYIFKVLWRKEHFFQLNLQLLEDVP